MQPLFALFKNPWFWGAVIVVAIAAHWWGAYRGYGVGLDAASNTSGSANPAPNDALTINGTGS